MAIFDKYPLYEVCGLCNHTYLHEREHLCSGDATGSLHGGTRIESHSQGASPHKIVTEITVKATPNWIEAHSMTDGFTPVLTDHTYTVEDQDGDPLPERLSVKVMEAITSGQASWETIERLRRDYNEWATYGWRDGPLFPDKEQFPQRLGWT